MRAREQFWIDYYTNVLNRGNAWLDYSNGRVQAQTFGLAIEAAGPLQEKRCLDIGCGRGSFCRTLLALDAMSVTGVDIVPHLIAEHKLAYPSIRWLCGSLQNPHLVEQLESYDVAFLLEVLQLMPLADTLRVLWNRLRPGGRIVAVVPNANCPIVSRTRERFDANYKPRTVAELDAVLRSCSDLEQAAYRGLSFRADQQVVPYDVSAWRTTGDWKAEPNRIQFIALKNSASGQ
jgi:2-polyprenyl-3-methyl-5-hydroxy-6-metoxy-1,4-benzoquinol methylase